MLEKVFDNVRKDFYSNLQMAQYRQEVTLQHFILGQLSALDRLSDEIRMLSHKTEAVGQDEPRIGFSGQ